MLRNGSKCPLIQSEVDGRERGGEREHRGRQSAERGKYRGREGEREWDGRREAGGKDTSLKEEEREAQYRRLTCFPAYL